MKEIILAGGYYAKVSEEDFDSLKVYLWRPFKQGNKVYAITGKSPQVFMHRFILNVTDPKIVVDHKDHDGLNNQRDNIRTCTQHQNGMNCRSTIGSKSKYLGVSWYKAYGKWSAQIHFMYKKKFLGYYEIEEDAARAYDAAAKELFGEFANPNFK